MQKMENSFANLFPRLLRTKPVVIFFIAAIAFGGKNYQDYIPWKTTMTPFTADADQYYSYLPAKFIHKDITFKYTDQYWATKLENGNKVQRFTCGIAILEAPWFAVGHYIAKKTGMP